MQTGLALDYETADKITILNLIDARSCLQKELDDYEDGAWLHPEDVAYNLKMVKALSAVIKHYGAE